MAINLILLISIFLVTTILLLVLNARYFYLSTSSRLQSIAMFQPLQHKQPINRLLLKLGSILKQILPQNLVNKLEDNYSFIGKDPSEMNISLAQAFLVFAVMLCTYLFSQNFIFLILAFVLSVLITFDSSFLVEKANQEIEENIEHLVQCLKILIVKSETPILSALEISLKDLPGELLVVKREVKKIINQAKKIGLVQTLNDWKTELPRFRDFISLLISINEGTSKSALKQSFDDYLSRIKEDNDEKQKAYAENLQLYLMGPVVLMLLVIMLPMVSAISYLMKNSGVI